MREPWNQGKIVGQKAPFKLKDIWALRVRLQMEHRVRELALLNLGIDRKLRGCDLVALKVCESCYGDQVATRAVVLQHKTQRPVQFEITPATWDALQTWIQAGRLEVGSVPLLQPTPRLTSSRYSPVRPGSSGTGLTSWAWTVRTTERTRCAGRRGRWSTGAPRSCAPCSYCLATPSSSRPCDTSGSTSMTRLRFLRKRRSDPETAAYPRYIRAATRDRLLAGALLNSRCRLGAGVRQRLLMGGATSMAPAKVRALRKAWPPHARKGHAQPKLTFSTLRPCVRARLLSFKCNDQAMLKQETPTASSWWHRYLKSPRLPWRRAGHSLEGAAEGGLRRVAQALRHRVD